jgi:phosphoribosylanthranilate isomerase
MIKVCGVRSVEAALWAADCGATAIGINLYPASVRSVSWGDAEAIAAAVHARLEVVAVVVDPSADLLRRAIALAPHWIQVHGALPFPVANAIHAIAIASPADCARACAAPGPWVLIDAAHRELRGGTGQPLQATWARQVCAIRPTVLAGGLDADNVAEAIAACRPFGVDAASGLEGSPGCQVQGKVAAFFAAARAALPLAC